MSDSKFSKMLSLTLPLFTLFLGIEIQMPQALAVDECGTAENVGDICYNSADGNYYRTTKNRRSWLSKNSWKEKQHKLSDKELRAAGFLMVPADCSGGADTDICHPERKGKRGKRGSGDGDVIYTDGGSGGSGGSGGGSGRGRGRGGRGLSAQGQYDLLKERCGDFEDYADERSKRKEEIEELLKNYKDGCTGDECQDLAALKTAVDAAQKAVEDKLASKECHNECVGLAIKNPSCTFAKVYGGNASDFCGDVSKEIVSPVWAAFIATMSEADQKVCKDNQGKGSGLAPVYSEGAICKKMFNDASCGPIVKGDGFKCAKDEIAKFAEANAKYAAAKKEYDELLAELKTLNGPTKTACRIKKASEVCSRWSEKEKVSLKCIDDIRSSCEDALNDALARLDEEKTTNPYCPTCDVYNRQAGNGVCLYAPCSGGVSKAAQIIGAAAGIVTPIGLGLIQMGMYNRGIDACMSAYTMQVQQATVVGLPPQSSNCGQGGYGMGGFMGGGLGGFGMGYPGMLGMGMGGYPGMGGGLGIMGGLGLNIGLGMGGYPGMGGMGMGMGYPGMMGGMGMGMGYPGMMGGYPGMMGGMGGMYGGGIGMGNQAAMYGNYQGVQQQMVASQQRMQEMMVQNMVLQQSQYTGYGLGGQYGMGYPYGGSMMGGGYGGYGGGGVGLGINPYGGAYGGYGGIGASPYGYGGYGAGGYGGGGISAGINIGLPSINAYAGASPYGYGGYGAGGYGGGYGGYGGGYGGYGAGYGGYGSGMGGCGYSMGVPCAY